MHKLSPLTYFLRQKRLTQCVAGFHQAWNALLTWGAAADLDKNKSIFFASKIVLFTYNPMKPLKKGLFTGVIT